MELWFLPVCNCPSKQCGRFQDWVFSLIIIPQRFIQVTTCIIVHSNSLLSGIPCRGWTRICLTIFLLKESWRELPASPVVRTQRSHCSGADVTPGQGAETPHCMQGGQMIIMMIKQRPSALSPA